jgi:hypothetical protein
MAASEGVDLEWCIVDMINSNTKQNRVYSANIKAQAEKCVDHVRKFAGSQKIQAWHSDDPKGPFGTVKGEPEPKTDVIFNIGGKVYCASVKMAGAVQLASGQGASTAKLFQAAANALPNKTEGKVVSSIIKSLETMPTRMLSSANYDRIAKEGSEKTIQEFIKNGKIITDKNYELWVQNNKPALMTSLLDYVENDLDFFAALIEESMTGAETLKAYKGAAADSIISPKGFHEIDIGYVYQILPKIKIDIRGKSRSGITGVAFRIDFTP